MTVQNSITHSIRSLYERAKWQRIDRFPSRYYSGARSAGELMVNPKAPGAVLIVGPICLESDGSRNEQDQFEDHLRFIQEHLEKILEEGWKLTDVYFEGGGTLQIPNWFREFCTQSGIRIRVVEPSDLPKAIPG